MKPHKHCEVIKAWADGHEIQYKDFAGRWISCPNPAFNESCEYRAKPKTIKYRVALLGNDAGVAYTYTAENSQNEAVLERSHHFVKWITDWIEVELE